MSADRKLPYSLAINEALHQMMAADSSVFLIGQGVKSPWYVGNTAQGLLEKFGDTRVIDTPVSENAITGAAVGAALAPRLVRGRQLVGFGVPARKVDERVRALGRCLEARGRADGRHWQLLMTAQGVLGRPANIAGGVGAVLLDLGYEPRQAPFMTSCFVVPTLLAHAIEAAETQAEILRHIPEAWVDYVGEGPRPSPRALAAAKG